MKSLIGYVRYKIKSKIAGPLLHLLQDAFGITRLDLLLGRDFRWIVSLIKHSNCNQNTSTTPSRWSVFSQFNEDSIINECLLTVLGSDDTSDLAVEFGSGGYSSNVALTAATFNLRVFMVDGSKTQLRRIKKTLETALRLLPQARNRITYIHKTLSSSNVSRDISEILNDQLPVIASVDIDSFDELIIKDLMIRGVPIIVAEYNSCFGPDAIISNYRPSSSHDMVEVDGRKIPIFGLSFNYLMSLCKANCYSCYSVEENGVNMVLIHNSYAHLFSSLVQPAFQRNKIYPYQLPQHIIADLEGLQ